MKKIVIAAMVVLSTTGSFASVTNTDSAAYHYQLGQRAYDARKYNDAWLEFEKASKYNPNNVDYYSSIAEVCQKLNKMAPAIAAIEKMHQLRPSDHSVTKRLFDLYANFGQWDKVTTMGTQVLQTDPDNADVCFAMGKGFYHQQNYGQAMTYLKKVIRKDDRNAEALYLCGRMQLNMSNYREAVKYYDAYMALDKTKAVRAYEFAMLLATTEDFDRSIEWFQKTLDLGYTANDDFYKNMAYTYADAGKQDKGIAMLKDLLKKRPEDIQLMDGIADACYRAGKYRDAIEYWDRIYDADGTNARALYRIGLAYIKSGDNDQGKVYCDKAIAMDPSLEVLRHKQFMQ